ncbi:MAG: PAS domain-containing protein [Desulfobacteraceae bacterium]|nr:PAS domain-containing protein [Desulfobacteraceae bacterium]
MSTEPITTDTHFLRDTINGLTEQIDLLTILQDLSKKIVSGFDFDQIITRFLDVVKEVVNYNACAIFLYDDDLQTYRVVSSRGAPMETFTADVPDNKIVDWIINEGRWTPIPDDSNTPEKHFQSILPLRGTMKKLGFLLMKSDKDDNCYNKANMTILSFIADQAGIALENQNLYFQLNYSRKYINNIVESINNGIVAIDLSGDITLINKNATAILGIESGDVIGKSYRDVFTDKLTKQINLLSKKIIDEGYVIETRFEHSPYKEFPITLGINASILLDENNDRLGIIFVFRDMLASMEIQRLLQLDEMKSEFVSNVSHELRTPLSIIKSYVEAILDQVDPDDYETQREFLSVVNEETDRLSGLVNDLLDISRIESGRFEISLAPVSLPEIIDSVIGNLKGETEDHKIITKIPSELRPISADKDKMTQVFINLINNAIKFSPEGGEIEIEVITMEKMLLCLVKDQGIGISEECIPRIFEKFYRVDTSDTYEIPGTGLGLPIVKHIINSHGGEITVKSKLNKGSEFILSLPYGEN